MTTSSKRHVVETMPWKNNFQRQDDQGEVEDVERSNQEDDMERACLHVETMPWKKLYSSSR